MSATTSDRDTQTASAEERELVGALRRGDEAAFVRLVQSLHGSMLRLAMFHVGERTVAEEVVQDAWVAVLLHRARSKVRAALERYLDAGGGVQPRGAAPKA